MNYLEKFLEATTEELEQNKEYLNQFSLDIDDLKEEYREVLKNNNYDLLKNFSEKCIDYAQKEAERARQLLDKGNYLELKPNNENVLKIISTKNERNALKLKTEKLKTDGLKLDWGMVECVKPKSERVDTISITGLEEATITLDNWVVLEPSDTHALQALYSLYLDTRARGDLGNPFADKLENYKVSIADLTQQLTGTKRTNPIRKETIIGNDGILKKLHRANLFGEINNKEVAVFTLIKIDKEEGMVYFSSPFFKTVFDEINRKHNNSKKVANHKLVTDLVKTSLGSQRNKDAVANVKGICILIEQAGVTLSEKTGKKVIHKKTIDFLKEYNPYFLDDLLEVKELKNQNRKLKRVFEQTFEYLHKHTDIFERYNDFKILTTEPPKMNNLSEHILRFEHQGKQI